MQKRLLAVAVAGALAAPAIALAQSTVQIYGQAEWEHGYMDQGKGRPKVDYQETTGSYLGFRGTEALGGGMSAWFQCETTMDIRAFDQVGLCSRNSGLGFRGGFGNVWVGRWHTPMSRALGQGEVGGEATGILGISYLAAGGSGSTSLASGTETTGASLSENGGSQLRRRFRRRETCLTTYETPNFSGFMVGAAVSCGNHAVDASNGAATAQKNDKPRLYSLAGTYTNGPLFVGLSYEKHDQVGPYRVGAPELSDDGWGISASYRFGSVKVGGMYLDREWETATANGVARDGKIKKKSAEVGLEWNIAGPHNLHMNYAWLDDSKGSATVGIEATSQGGIAAPGSGTGAQSYSIAYQYNLSKRTSAKLGYTLMDNDKNSRAARLGTAASLTQGGEEQSAFALVVKHRF